MLKKYQSQRHLEYIEQYCRKKDTFVFHTTFGTHCGWELIRHLEKIEICIKDGKMALGCNECSKQFNLHINKVVKILFIWDKKK